MTAATGAAGRVRTDLRWRVALGSAIGLGLAIRVIAVLARPHLAPWGDAGFYHAEANLLVEGKGWINPFLYAKPGHPHVATAAFPPLFTVLLAMSSLVGAKSFIAHRLWCAIIGTSAIPLGAWVGRQIGGRRVALMAAFVIAVYPNLWMPDAQGMSETLSPVLVLIVVGVSFRLWRKPTLGRAAWLGAALGVAALGRDEMALMIPVVMVPLCLTRRVGFRQGLRLLGAGVGMTVLVLGPWVGYNMTRFTTPVFISDGLGVTLASANCNTTWHGVFEGYWSLPCSLAADTDPQGDEAAQGASEQHSAVTYVEKHLSDLPAVEAARLGRAFGLFHPVQQIDYDSFIESRPRLWAFVGLGMYYVLAALAIPGAVILRRRRVLILPMVAVLVDVVFSVVLTFGQTRYRATLEGVLVLLAAVTVDAVLARRTRPPVAGPEDDHPSQTVDEREVLVVIPALDEERSVAGVIRRVRAVIPAASVLVVDDGSSDATAVLARAAGADVAVSPFTLGVGGAMRVGFRYAVSHGFRAVVQVDADGQHEPTDLPLLLGVLDGGDRPHVVVGCRFGTGSSGPSTPLLRRVAMRSLAAYVSHRTGSRLDDVTSGFRAHNRAAVELFARHYPAEYLSDTVESLVLAHQAGARIDQVPVHMHAREAGAPSQSTFWSVAYLARVSLILVLGVIRRRPHPDLTRGAPWPAST